MMSLSSPGPRWAISSILDFHPVSTMKNFSLTFLFPFLYSEKLRKGMLYANKYSGNIEEIRTELLVNLLPAVSCLPALKRQRKHVISTVCHADNLNLGIIWNQTMQLYKSLFQRVWKVSNQYMYFPITHQWVSEFHLNPFIAQSWSMCKHVSQAVSWAAASS